MRKLHNSSYAVGSVFLYLSHNMKGKFLWSYHITNVVHSTQANKNMQILMTSINENEKRNSARFWCSKMHFTNIDYSLFIGFELWNGFKHITCINITGTSALSTFIQFHLQHDELHSYFIQQIATTHNQLGNMNWIWFMWLRHAIHSEC